VSQPIRANARRFFTLCLVVAALSAGVLVGRLGHAQKAEDAFWSNAYVEGVMGETFESLDQLTRASDVVVTGHITSFTKSRSWVAEPQLGDDGIAFYAKAAVSVDEVLSGSYLAGGDGSLGVEFFIPNWPQFPRMAASIPTEQVLLFLRRQPDTKDPLYRVVNISQGYFRDGQHVGTPVGASEPWVVDLGRLTFTDLIAEVRQAVTAN